MAECLSAECHFHGIIIFGHRVAGMSKTSEDAKRSNEQPMPGVSTSGTSQSATLRPNSSPGNAAGPSRIIGSQAKRQEDVTRQGTQKMKWV